MIIFLILFCCCCSMSAMYAYPFPKKDSDILTGYTRIAVQRVPFNTDGSFESPPEDGCKENCIEDKCMKNCNADKTCKGFSVWSESVEGETDPVGMCVKHKDTPNAWMSINQFFVNKKNSGIYSKN